MVFSDDQLTRDKFLNGRLHIFQPKEGYRAATDPVLLAAACPANKGESVLDIGCGAGTAALCVASRVDVSLAGLELQSDYADLARRNAAENDKVMKVFQGDLLQVPASLKEQVFDHVIMNPPFFGSGAKASDEGRALARQEQIDLAVWIDVGLRRLRQQGWLTLIQTIERLPEVILALHKRAGGLEIKPLSPRANKPASRFVIRAMKGSKSKPLLSNPLILHDGASHLRDTDDYSKAARAILRDGETLEF